jgi:hypothetical protein
LADSRTVDLFSDIACMLFRFFRSIPAARVPESFRVVANHLWFWSKKSASDANVEAESGA